MEKTYFHDLRTLGQKITEYCRAMENYRALLEGREFLAKGLRDKYPNMQIQAIHKTLWQQEEDARLTAQVLHNEIRVFAYSVGWDIEYKEVSNEVQGILHKEIKKFNDINV